MSFIVSSMLILSVDIRSMPVIISAIKNIENTINERINLVTSLAIYILISMKTAIKAKLGLKGDPVSCPDIVKSINEIKYMACLIAL